jgi:hypothetical protein
MALIENQKVLMRWNSRNKNHFVSKGYLYTKMGEEFYVNVEDLTEFSNAEVMCSCDYSKCDNTFPRRYCDYTKAHKQSFCSMECQSKWQAECLVGENSPSFNNDIPLEERYVNCDWCKQKTLVYSLYKLKQIEEEGSKHFCSVECRREWYAKEWSQSEEWKLESAERSVKMLEDGVFGIESEAQRKVNSFLNDLNIKYTNEYNCKYVSIDNYLLDYNLMIEVMGTFWHTDPRIYNEINYQNQVDRIKNDKIKSTYIKNNYGINILYLWEEDITNDEELCKNLILSYIQNNGKLDNYHSFNYFYDGSLHLNDELITPYMEYDIDELKTIINITDSKRRSMKQPDKWITFHCEQCGEEKEQLISHYNNSSHHFCSAKCSQEYRKGKPRNLNNCQQEDTSNFPFIGL